MVTANAYLGAWGIVEALERGADVVVCPRVTDAALVVGPAAWKFGWKRDDWDRLAGGGRRRPHHRVRRAVHRRQLLLLPRGAGHRASASPSPRCTATAPSSITKHPGTGGLVSVGTITAQLLYEIRAALLQPRRHGALRHDPARAGGAGPGARHGIKGEPAPPTTKVCINYLGGYRNSMTFVLTGLDIEGKARLAEETLWKLLGGRERFAETHVRAAPRRSRRSGSNEEAFAYLR